MPITTPSTRPETAKDELVFAKQLVKEAGHIFLQHFGRSGPLWTADNNPFTEADRDIAALMLKKIARAFPADAILGAGVSDFKTAERVWVVNALDGTQPYACGLPLATVSVAFMLHGEPVVAVAFDPILNTIYYAQKGRGAHKNGHVIHVTDALVPAQNFFVLSTRMPPGFASAGHIHDEIERDHGKAYNFRSFIYAAAKVAEGVFAGAVVGKGNTYDIAAAALLVTEAGGTVTDLQGQTADVARGANGLVVSNGPLHARFLSYMQK
jgi:myo-inositol-1(or 4)-monophosphatase